MFINVVHIRLLRRHLYFKLSRLFACYTYCQLLFTVSPTNTSNPVSNILLHKLYREEVRLKVRLMISLKNYWPSTVV